MVYFLNADGSTTLIKNGGVYQNSNKANEIVVVAPFSTYARPSARFRLPNGIDVQGGLMTPASYGNIQLTDANGNRYNAWAYLLDAPITQYAGVVRVQFDFALGDGVHLATYTSQFEVYKGVASDLPDYTVGSDALDVFNTIKDYLATIGEDIEEGLNNGIAYVRYRTNDAFLLNTVRNFYRTPDVYLVSGENIINSTNTNTIKNYTKGKVTAEGMTEFLTPEIIKNPGASISTEETEENFFFQYNPTNENVYPPQNPAGFIIDLGASVDIGIVQLYLANLIDWGQTINLEISTSDSDDYNSAFASLTDFELKTITTSFGSNPNAMLILRTEVGKKARFIKVVQNSNSAWKNDGAYICYGIEVFSPNQAGYYEIVQNDGNFFNINALDWASINNSINQANRWANGDGAVEGDPQYQNNAKYYAEESQHQAEESQKWADGEGATVGEPQYENNAKYWSDIVQQYSQKANQVGGFPVLVAGSNGQPVIPSILINQVDVKEYITITDENQLQTITAQVGDVALLVETVNNEKTVVKSWILLNEINGVRDWAIFGTSFAATSGVADYSTQSQNTQFVRNIAVDKVTQSAYDDLIDKSGIYFVTMG